MNQTTSLIERVLRSIFFSKATGKAGQYARNSGKLLDLVQRVTARIKQVGAKDSLGEVYQKVQLLVRMVKAYAKGQYPTLPWKSLVSIVATLIYLVSPIDVIPDFLPVIGFTDDIALVFWLFNSINDDIEAFEKWEKERDSVIIE